MRLYIEADAIHCERATREAIDTARVAAVLIERGRHPIIARILAFGGTLDTSAARQFGEELGLYEKGK
jgi:hypothetical protein